MDKQTLSHYGFILIATIIVVAILSILSPVTPFGDTIKSSINNAVEKYVSKTDVDDIDNERTNVDTNPTELSNSFTVTMNFVYENGKTASDSIKFNLKYGDVFEPNSHIVSIDGYKPTNIPPKQTITKNTDFTIIYAPDAYIITFTTNGGTIVSNTPTTYKTGETVKLPTNVIKDGYSFIGWYDNADLIGNKINEIPPSTKGDKTFYAKWSNKFYKIKYFYKDTDITNDIITEFGDEYGIAVYGTDLALPTLSSLNGLTFAGWYSDKLLTGYPISSTGDKVENDLVFYAKYSNNEYTITYHENGGSIIGSYPISYKTGDTTTLPITVEKHGYTFNGWYSEIGLENKIEKIESSENGNKEFWAAWTPNEYNIIYDTNGGSMDASTAFYKYTYNTINDTDAYTTTISKPGYSFVGWKDLKLGTLETCVKAGRAEDVVLEAQWREVSFEITYNANGGAPSIQTIPIAYGVKYGDGPSVAKANYTFVGWFREPDGNNIVNASDVFTGTNNETLYAHWSPNVYNIYYITNGGDFETTPIQNYTYGVGLSPLPSNITKQHYSFSGWYSDNECTIPKTSITTTDSGIIYLYANWTAEIYDIVYDLDGGEMVVTENDRKYTYGIGKNELPFPTKTGYMFGGWYNSEIDEIVTSISPEDSGNKTFTAIWLEYQTNVTINLVYPDGSDVYGNEKLQFTFENIEYNKEYNIDENELINIFLSENDFLADYYHNADSFSYTYNYAINPNNSSFDAINSVFSINKNIVIYPYRNLNVKVYYDGIEQGFGESSEHGYLPLYRFKNEVNAELEIRDIIGVTFNINGENYIKSYILEETNLGENSIDEFINNGNNLLKLYYVCSSNIVSYTFNTDSINGELNHDNEILVYEYSYQTTPSFRVIFPTKEHCFISNIEITSGCTISSVPDDEKIYTDIIETEYNVTSPAPIDISIVVTWSYYDVLSDIHNLNIDITPATCTTGEVKTYTCSTCDFYYQETGSPLGHIPTAYTNLNNATYHYRGCQRQGCQYVNYSTVSYLDAVQHSFNSGTVTANANCTSGGTKVYTCTVCNYQKTETTPALGHNYVYGTYGSGTCTDPTWTGSKCSRCASVNGKTIGTANHNFDSWCSTGHLVSKTSYPKSTLLSDCRYSDSAHASSSYGFYHYMCRNCYGLGPYVRCKQHPGTPGAWLTCPCSNHARGKVRCGNTSNGQYYLSGTRYTTSSWCRMKYNTSTGTFELRSVW